MCNKHYLRMYCYGRTDLLPIRTDQEVLLEQIRQGEVPDHRPDLGPCWMWTGALHSGGRTGYGWFRGRALAHRASYEIHVGPIPSGEQVDHLCRVRLCVNPGHLESVTPRVNVLRSEAPNAVAVRTGRCRRGHPFSGRNLYVVPGTGYRRCLACVAIRMGKAYAHLL
jgi:hypothetical protein